MSKVFLDANILMEIMMARSKLEKISEILHDSRHEFFISSLSVHILYYFAELEGIERSFTRYLTGLAQHLPLSSGEIAKAQERYDGRDFEDCLQAACAESGGCDQILTLDRAFKKNSATKLTVRVVK